MGLAPQRRMGVFRDTGEGTRRFKKKEDRKERREGGGCASKQRRKVGGEGRWWWSGSSSHSQELTWRGSVTSRQYESWTLTVMTVACFTSAGATEGSRWAFKARGFFFSLSLPPLSKDSGLSLPMCTQSV